MTSLPKSLPQWFALFAAALLTSASAFAQAPAADSHTAHHPAANAQQADLSEGEVIRVDAAALKVTLRHGELKNLNMPPMTMVFQVADPALMEGFKVGDAVSFHAESPAGKLTVTKLQKQ